MLPRFQVSQPIDGAALSTDPQVGILYAADPLVFSRITLSLGRELLDAADRTVTGGADIQVPTLLLHGADDRLCLPSGTEALRQLVVTSGSEMEIYPGLRHEIFNEPEHEKIFERVLGWFEAREEARS